MRTVEQKVYKFDELSDAAKEVARDWWRQGDDMHWKEYVYEDADRIAKLIGIEIDQRPYKTMGGSTRYEPCIWFSGFSSQGDGACFEGRYSYAKGSVKAIKEYAPEDTELHAIAEGLYEIQRKRRWQVTATVKHRGHYYHSGCTEIECDGIDYEDDADKDVRQLLRDFMDWIYDRLKEEDEYQNDDEQVDDNIRANDYEFEENGDFHS